MAMVQPLTTGVPLGADLPIGFRASFFLASHLKKIDQDTKCKMYLLSASIQVTKWISTYVRIVPDSGRTISIFQLMFPAQNKKRYGRISTVLPQRTFRCSQPNNQTLFTTCTFSSSPQNWYQRSKLSRRGGRDTDDDDGGRILVRYDNSQDFRHKMCSFPFLDPMLRWRTILGSRYTMLMAGKCPV